MTAMRSPLACSCLVMALTVLVAVPAAAADQPLWELGLGVGGLRLPHYRGSDQSHTWVLPVPYVVYRGDILKADREGARALLFESDRVNLDLSVSASAPTRSRDNEARRGMADLAPTVELGPNLNWTLSRAPNWKLDLRLPVRAVVTVESGARMIGWNATPNLNLDIENLKGWNLGLQAGPVFASRGLHGHYYDVSATDATASRSAYRARGGAGGMQALAALSRRVDNHWTGFFIRYDNVSGARFADSPLVHRREHLSFGVAMSWVFATSSRQVSGTD
jgi:outer membrane protein